MQNFVFNFFLSNFLQEKVTLKQNKILVKIPDKPVLICQSI